MKEPQLPLQRSPQPQPQLQQPQKSLRFVTLGAGSRGTAYAQAVTTTTNGCIHAVADPHAFKRREFGRRFIWGESSPAVGQEFGDWREWVEYEVGRRKRRNHDLEQNDGLRQEGIHGVFICTLDHTHIEIVHSIATNFPDLHILCEKPLALSLDDCLSVYRSLSIPGSQNTRAIFSIGHVLRYSPHNNILRRVVLHDRAIGDIVSLEHTEPVGWWHFAHSYVRGNWRRETLNGDGSLLTKSCHDIDFILWLLCTPSPAQDPNPNPGHGPGTGTETGTAPRTTITHHPRTITSTGTLTQFTRANKPPAAAQANATNCLSCPSEPECPYSAPKIYRDAHLARTNRGWPVDVVVPDIEDTFTKSGPHGAEEHLLAKLREDYSSTTMPDSEIASRPWYGRCVYDGDNSVCDDQVVTITWDDATILTPSSGSANANLRPKTAVFHMIAPTEKQCQRRGRVYGTTGEIAYDSETITVHSFAPTACTRTIEVPPTPPDQQESHGGGDYGLARGFVGAVDAVVNRGWAVRDAQVGFLGCTLEEVVRSHAVVFAAEEARREERVVKWREWWEEKLDRVGMVP